MLFFPIVDLAYNLPYFPHPTSPAAQCGRKVQRLLWVENRERMFPETEHDFKRTGDKRGDMEAIQVSLGDLTLRGLVLQA